MLALAVGVEAFGYPITIATETSSTNIIFPTLTKNQYISAAYHP